ncbi:phycoerythrobilin:ferredoxin oxidoreductase [Prochlorococcus sp. MIT 1300]|uniref:phycoerythrobilin:ferredoxin oxidoreductase n=1 Tax=Prochlorococcus sp. MIT 1300 TaxID=3096218 RepID=UPI002A75F2AF|nr:phycoerythrobilin:ferredoxin oxidoreductase [Prochlorococcus sp. MIT 1300]
MNLKRQNSLDPVKISNWKWAPFLDLAIKEFTSLEVKPYLIEEDFLEKTSSYGSRAKPSQVHMSTWGCQTRKLRLVRAACLNAGNSTSVLNLVASPFSTFNLPFFGADFVTLPSGHLLALDLQPALRNECFHTDAVWERLLPIYDFWRKNLPEGGAIPESAKPYFSPGFLWSRLPLDSESDRIIKNILLPAFHDYLNLYLDLVNGALEVDNSMSNKISIGQKNYFNYRAINDPARGMLTRFYGREWTEKYIHDVLFNI